jgi:hypothetical protein
VKKPGSIEPGFFYDYRPCIPSTNLFTLLPAPAVKSGNEQKIVCRILPNQHAQRQTHFSTQG